MAKKLLFRDENLTGPAKEKYEVLNHLFEYVSGVLEKHGLDFYLTDEAGSYPGGLYKETGDWAVGAYTPHGRSAKVIISDKAIEALSDLAFEGLLLQASTRMLLFNEATRNSRVALRKMEKMPRPRQDARVYTQVDRFFKTEGLIPFKVEAGNIDWREGNRDIEYWKEYLDALRNVLPEDAGKILEGLEFKNEL